MQHRPTDTRLLCNSSGTSAFETVLMKNFFGSTAENNFTGMFINPNVIEPVQIECILLEFYDTKL